MSPSKCGQIVTMRLTTIRSPGLNTYGPISSSSCRGPIVLARRARTAAERSIRGTSAGAQTRTGRFCLRSARREIRVPLPYCRPRGRPGPAQAVEMRVDKGRFSSTSRNDASMVARSRIAPVRSGCGKRPAPHPSGGVPGRSLGTGMLSSLCLRPAPRGRVR